MMEPEKHAPVRLRWISSNEANQVLRP